MIYLHISDNHSSLNYHILMIKNTFFHVIYYPYIHSFTTNSFLNAMFISTEH